MMAVFGVCQPAATSASGVGGGGTVSGAGGAASGSSSAGAGAAGGSSSSGTAASGATVGSGGAGGGPSTTGSSSGSQSSDTGTGTGPGTGQGGSSQAAGTSAGGASGKGGGDVASPGDDGSCSCRAAPAPASSRWMAPLALLALLALRRRSRRPWHNRRWRHERPQTRSSLRSRRLRVEPERGGADPGPQPAPASRPAGCSAIRPTRCDTITASWAFACDAAQRVRFALRRSPQEARGRPGEGGCRSARAARTSSRGVPAVREHAPQRRGARRRAGTS